MKKRDRVLAWWFSADKDGTLRHGDGRKHSESPVLEVNARIAILCEVGLHASERIIDCLKYAPGNFLWRVVVSGGVHRSRDKLCGLRREALWSIDAEEVLQALARWSALQHAHKYKASEVVLRWLLTGDEAIRSAAYSAADSAAYSAARSAADSAAHSAERKKQNRQLLKMIRQARAGKTKWIFRGPKKK